MHLHMLQEPLPIDLVIGAQNKMGDIRAIIAVPVLNEAFGPDQFRRADELHGMMRFPAA